MRDRAACSALGERERDELARLGYRRCLTRGEMLFAAGDDNDLCAMLIRGALKISSCDEDGTEHILSLVHPAGFVGELFAPLAHYDFVALTDSELCVFARPQYEDAIARFPALGRALLRRSSEDLFASRALLASISSRSASQRVAGFLLAMANAASESPCHPAPHFELIVTRGEMGSLLGLSIETVSRQLGRLERDGVITRKGSHGVELVDAVRLGTIAA